MVKSSLTPTTPYGPNIRHDLRSVTKSFIGTLTGIEVQQRLLDSVDHPVVDLFADKHISNVGESDDSSNMLDMTSGIAWSEDAYTPDENMMRMYKAPDITEFVLSQPMSDAPGAALLLRRGQSVHSVCVDHQEDQTRRAGFCARRAVQTPGYSSVRWGEADAQDVTDGESGLYLTPHDMAKLGYLYPHQGSWDGQQLIPSSWVDRARQGPVTATDGFRYGNLWWSLPGKGTFMARGRHSQIILVLPKLDIVAVMTGALKDGYVPTTNLIDGIAGAIKSDASLPLDSAAESLLAASIQKAAEIGVGNSKFRFKPNLTDKQVAYANCVELSTRKIGLPIDFDHDVIAEVYDSWFTFFR